MRVFNYSEARQKFSTLLNLALKDDVFITRKDGSKFKLVHVEDEPIKSPFDVEGIDVDLTTSEIVEILRDSRSSE